MLFRLGLSWMVVTGKGPQSVFQRTIVPFHDLGACYTKVVSCENSSKVSLEYVPFSVCYTIIENLNGGSLFTVTSVLWTFEK